MSTNIKDQVLAHLDEQEKEHKAKVAAAKAAEEAKQKAYEEDLARFLAVCRNYIEPAMREFANILDGRIFEGKVEARLANQGRPQITFQFSSDTNPRLASLQYTRAVKIGFAESTASISNVQPTTTQVPLDTLTNAFVQEQLLSILRKLKA